MAIASSLVMTAVLDTDGMEKSAKRAAATLNNVLSKSERSFEELSTAAESFGHKLKQQERTTADTAKALRTQVREMNKADRAYAALSTSLTDQSAAMKMTAKDAEIYLNTAKLGEHATDEQRKTIAELTASLYEQKQAQDAATAATNKAAAASKAEQAAKELTAQTTQSLTTEYRQMAAALSMSADEQERSAALRKLGANATETQQQAVLKAVTAYQAERKAVAASAAAQEAKALAEKKAAKAAAQSEKAFADVTRQLNSQITMMKMDSPKAAAIYAAQMRLGENATEAQRKEVERLVNEQYKLAAAQNKTGRSMRNFRGQMSNVGYQLNDIAVQAQMGVDKFVILGQQGSQLAASFGPAGPLIGAGIAAAAMLGGTLVRALDDTANATETLKDSMEALQKIATKQDGIYVATSALKELAQWSERAAKLEIAIGMRKAREGAIAAAKGFSSAEGAVKDFIEAEKALTSDVSGSAYVGYTASLKEMKRQYGLGEEGVKKLVRQLDSIDGSSSAAELEEVANYVEELASKASGEAAENLQDLTSELYKSTKAAADFEQMEKQLPAVLDDTASSIEAAIDAEVAAGEKRADAVEQQFTDAVKAEEEGNKRRIESMKAVDSEIEALEKAERKRRTDAGQERLAQLKADQKALQDQIKLNDARAVSEATLIRTMRDQYVQTVLSGKELEEYNLLMLEGELRAKGFSEATIQQAVALQRAQYAAEAAAAAANKTNLSGGEDAWAKYAKSIEDALADTDQLAVDMVNNITTQVSQGITDAIYDAKNVGDMAGDVLMAIGESATQMLIQMGVQRLALAAMNQSTAAAENTAYMASVQGRGQAETALGAINAGAATAAIPVVGPAMAPAAAAAFELMGQGFTAAAVAAASTSFAGAFDKGGYISSGQTGIVSEYGDELVNGVLVKGPARVTSREETNNIMNQGGSTSLTYAPVISGVLDSGDLDKILVKNYKGVERAMAKANRQRRKS